VLASGTRSPLRSATVPAEYGAGLKLTIERGWLWMHESGTYVKFTGPAPSRSLNVVRRTPERSLTDRTRARDYFAEYHAAVAAYGREIEKAFG
jgi:hypothetical protein